MLCCHHAIPAIVRAGGGAVVNMSSGAALRGASPAHVYSAAKGGVLSLTRALAGTYARNNVRVNAICAGRILTGRILSRYGTPDAPKPAEDQQADERVKEYPFWVGTPEDIATIALFLASEESRMITGAAIPADGGRSAY
jgi:NAD(P)-dependent dehydrogenase (short-subunit alcohol dehydrogenase family)